MSHVRRLNRSRAYAERSAFNQVADANTPLPPVIYDGEFLAPLNDEDAVMITAEHLERLEAMAHERFEAFRIAAQMVREGENVMRMLTNRIMARRARENAY